MKKTLFFTGAVILLFQSVQAGQTVSFAGPAEGEKSRHCGQACNYKRANGTASVQALYLLNKVPLLDACQGTDRCLRDNLGEFCFPSESETSCFQRYKTFAIQDLQRLRTAIGRNDSASVELKTETAHRIATTVDEAEKRTPITPELPDLKGLNDLNEHYEAESARMRNTLNYRTSQVEVAESHVPKQEDFVKFKESERKGKSGEKIQVADTSCGKDLCYDEEAFKKAMIEYDKVKLDPALLQAIPKDQTLKKVKLNDEKTIGENSALAYEAAQQTAVEAANKAINGGEQTITFSDPKAGSGKKNLKKVNQPKPGSEDVYISMKRETLEKEIKDLNPNPGASVTPSLAPATRTTP